MPLADLFGNSAITPFGVSLPPVGPKGQLTPQQVAALRAQAAAMQGSAGNDTRTAPAALADIINAISAQRMIGRADSEEKLGRESAAEAMASLYRPFLAPEAASAAPAGAAVGGAGVPTTAAAPPPGGPSAPTSAFGPAIASIESRGSDKPYETLGPVIEKTGDRAYGKYQVMGANIPTWTEQYAGKRMTPAEFLANPAAQDAVFNGEFGKYVQKYGPEGAARAWFAGEPNMNNMGAKDPLGTTVSGYAQKFNAAMGPQQSPLAPMIGAMAGRPMPVPQPAPAAAPQPAPAARAPAQDGLPQPLTSATGQMSPAQLAAIIANPYVPDSAKAAAIQMIQQKGQPQTMDVEGGKLMFNSAGQKVFIPEPKFSTIEIAGSKVPIVSNYDPATKQWTTKTMTPGGGSASGAKAAEGEPDLSTLGGIMRAEAAQKGAIKAAESAAAGKEQHIDPKILTTISETADKASDLSYTARRANYFKEKIDSGQLDPSLAAQGKAAIESVFGKSSEKARLYNEFESFKTQMANSNLRLQAGVQTEGDAIRAKEEFVSGFGKYDAGTMSQSLGNLVEKLGRYVTGPAQQQFDSFSSAYQNQKPFDAYRKGMADNVNFFTEFEKRASAAATKPASAPAAPAFNPADLETEMRRRGLLPSTPPTVPISQ